MVWPPHNLYNLCKRFLVYVGCLQGELSVKQKRISLEFWRIKALSSFPICGWIRFPGFSRKGCSLNEGIFLCFWIEDLLKTESLSAARKVFIAESVSSADSMVCYGGKGDNFIIPCMFIHSTKVIRCNFVANWGKSSLHSSSCTCEIC